MFSVRFSGEKNLHKTSARNTFVSFFFKVFEKFDQNNHWDAVNGPPAHKTLTTNQKMIVGLSSLDLYQIHEDWKLISRV